MDQEESTADLIQEAFDRDVDFIIQVLEVSLFISLIMIIVLIYWRCTMKEPEHLETIESDVEDLELGLSDS